MKNISAIQFLDDKNFYDFLLNRPICQKKIVFFLCGKSCDIINPEDKKGWNRVSDISCSLSCSADQIDKTVDRQAALMRTRRVC